MDSQGIDESKVVWMSSLVEAIMRGLEEDEIWDESINRGKMVN